MRVHFNNGWTIENPEERIHEYTEIEVYRGYDDFHSVDDTISWADIRAADKLYANIMRFWRKAGEELVASQPIRIHLGKVRNVELDRLTELEWNATKQFVSDLISQCVQIRGVGLAVATKVLHLKRPKLFPILDGYVVSFLMGRNLADASKNALVGLGMEALEIVRNDLVRNSEAFNLLVSGLRSLPIQLEKVRLYDILCWTIEKWNRRGISTAPFGIAKRSLNLARQRS